MAGQPALVVFSGGTAFNSVAGKSQAQSSTKIRDRTDRLHIAKVAKIFKLLLSSGAGFPSYPL